MDHTHKIQITISRDMEKIVRIDLEPDDRLHGDSLALFLAKYFRPPVWAAVRGLVRMDGRPVFQQSEG
jgi:hypothetical protein